MKIKKSEILKRHYLRLSNNNSLDPSEKKLIAVYRTLSLNEKRALMTHIIINEWKLSHE